MDIKAIDNKYVAGTYARIPIALVGGKGAKVWDDEGKEYIDLGSGIAVNTLGYGDEEWVKAVAEQAAKLQHTSNYFYTEPCAELAQLICESTGMKKVFFGNSGAEANECAIKTARKWAFDKYGDESHSTVITLKQSFHGRTIATLTATGQDVFHRYFGPFNQGFVYAEPENIEQLKQLADENKCCAVMLETVQGEGGVNVLSAEYVKAVAKLCEDKDMLLIVDEVQTGNGRTGKLFSYMHYGIMPDIMTTAKGLAGGLPIGACILGERVETVLGHSDHGSTFGGNPVSCAAAVSVFKRLTDDLLDSVAAKGKYIKEELEKAEGVKSVTGMGLMLGIALEKPLKDVLTGCREKGVLALTANGKLRLLPPLTITDEELKAAVEIIKEVVKP